MENPIRSEIQITAERFFTMLRSLDAFNEVEMRGTLMHQLQPSLREQCYLGNYLRTIANVKTLLKLTDIRDCQAIAMIARSVFEAAIEVALIDRIDRGPEKILAFSDLERLRHARKIVSSVNRIPPPIKAADSATQTAFIAREGSQIEAKKDELWPGAKKISHWSLKDLRARAEIAGNELLDIYDSEYQLHSWYVHSGLTGFLNTQKEFYIAISATAFHLAAESFEMVLESMIKTFQLYRTDDKLRDKLTYAKQVAFTDGASEASTLWNGIVG